MDEIDVVVIGAGHAGCEAAYAAALLLLGLSLGLFWAFDKGGRVNADV